MKKRRIIIAGENEVFVSKEEAKAAYGKDVFSLSLWDVREEGILFKIWYGEDQRLFLKEADSGKLRQLSLSEELLKEDFVLNGMLFKNEEGLGFEYTQYLDMDQINWYGYISWEDLLSDENNVKVLIEPRMTSRGYPLDQDGNVDLKDGSVTLLQDGSENAFPKEAKITYDGDKVTVTAANEFEITFKVDKNVTTTSQDGSISLDITGIGAMRVQIGANEGQVLAIRIPEVSLDTLGLSDIDISTQEGAQRAIELSKQANAYISSVRSRIGAYENRLEHTQSSLGVTEENVTSAFSRIMDTDMAEEMTEYANQQVLNQAGISVLTQANQRPAEVLQLLQ